MKLLEFLVTYFNKRIRFVGKTQNQVSLIRELATFYPPRYNDNFNEYLLVALGERNAASIDGVNNIPLNFMRRAGIHLVEAYVSFEDELGSKVSCRERFITKKKSWLIKKIKQVNTHEEWSLDDKLGKILEFPSCCVHAFRTISSDPYFPKHFYPKGLETVIFHFQCKRNCPKSKKLIKRYSYALKRACCKLYLEYLGFWYCLTHLNEI